MRARRAGERKKKEEEGEKRGAHAIPLIHSTHTRLVHVPGSLAKRGKLTGRGGKSELAYWLHCRFLPLLS